ncbi:hypothetical protein [Paraburkholderia bannensis]|nr:hypothetical protein [Paraburkholderia bannensis]
MNQPTILITSALPGIGRANAWHSPASRSAAAAKKKVTPSPPNSAT